MYLKLAVGVMKVWNVWLILIMINVFQDLRFVMD